MLTDAVQSLWDFTNAHVGPRTERLTPSIVEALAEVRQWLEVAQHNEEFVVQLYLPLVEPDTDAEFSTDTVVMACVIGAKHMEAAEEDAQKLCAAYQTNHPEMGSLEWHVTPLDEYLKNMRATSTVLAAMVKDFEEEVPEDDGKYVDRG